MTGRRRGLPPYDGAAAWLALLIKAAGLALLIKAAGLALLIKAAGLALFKTLTDTQGV
jgi:hypothetical protein